MIYELKITGTDEKWIPVGACVVGPPSAPTIECKAIRKQDGRVYEFYISRYQIDNIFTEPIKVRSREAEWDGLATRRKVFVRCLAYELIPWLERLGVLVEFERCVEIENAALHSS